jgi:hypothetical protein
MTTIHDLTSWERLDYFNIKGTREKGVYQSPDGIAYYFKTSIQKENKHFPFEFWSEVIAYELGKILNINVLRYDVGILDDKIGCVSKSMIGENQQLIEGLQYLQAFDSGFNPSDKKQYSKYTFQFIEKALQKAGLSIYVRHLIEVIIFDALIGNQDRHQENWGIIIDYTNQTKEKTIYSDNKLNSTSDKAWYLKVLGIKPNKPATKEVSDEYLAHKKQSPVVDHAFAPIYDSGSSLGRELLPEKVKRMLRDKTEYKAYMMNGQSEIHWEGKRLKYSELIPRILENTDYPDVAVKMGEKLALYDETKFHDAMANIDKDIPSNFASLRLPQERKELILRLVSSRVELVKGFLL